MNCNFSISEFNISGQSIPEEIADKILRYHIVPMQEVRELMGIPVSPSQKSGYRPKAWELKQGRSGGSQHTFEGKGAVDWTCENFMAHKAKLLEAIIKCTDYTRFAVYNSFIHCDYASTSSKREMFTSGSDSKWKFKKYV